MLHLCVGVVIQGRESGYYKDPTLVRIYFNPDLLSRGFLILLDIL